MGLDMYLYRVPKMNSLEELNAINSRLDNAFVNGSLSDELKAVHKENKYIYDIDFSISAFIDIEKYKKDPKGWGSIISLDIRVAYWRKFNALHSWFVANVQYGIDECEPHIVTIDHLKKLREDLKELNKTNVDEKFATQGGFFFGSTDYDDYFWADVERLKCEVEYLINQQPTDTMYVYQSNW
jgi:hypothetical protein